MKYSVGFTCGAFDLLHPGHIHLLTQAKQQCDTLIVGLQTNPQLDRAWKRVPVQSIYTRWAQLSALKSVNQVIPYDTEADLYNLLTTVNPSVRFLGSEYKDMAYTGNTLGIPIVFIPRNHLYSSTTTYQAVVNHYDHYSKYSQV